MPARKKGELPRFSSHRMATRAQMEAGKLMGSRGAGPEARAHRAAWSVSSANVAREHALTATEHANKVNTKAAHTAASAAHHQAATAADKAGISGGGQAHREQANRHSFAARNTAKSGAFGTDPATGNTQSKAQVSGVGVKSRVGPLQASGTTHSVGGNQRVAEQRSRSAQASSVKANGKFGAEGAKAHEAAAASHRQASTAQRSVGNVDKAIEHSSKAGYHDVSAKSEASRAQGPGYTREAIAHGNHEYIRPRVMGVHDPIPKGATRIGQNGPLVSVNKDKSGKATGYTVHDKSPLDKANEKYHDASIKANVASNKANKSGKYLDHVSANAAHIRAAGLGKAVGLDTSSHTAAMEHHQTAAVHPAAQKSGAKLHPTNLGAKVTPQVPAMKGTSPLGAKGTAPGHTVSGDAATHAMAASAKAQAKPSLASHSLAAKAHLHAASVNSNLADAAKRAGLHEHASAHQNAATVHTARAMDHKLLASQHSHSIMKLKKLGPGQHHGRGGRFEGTPGGAK